MARSCCGKRREATRENPILVGEPDGRLYRCTVLVGSFGLAYGDSGIFTGTGVMERVAVGTLKLD